MRALFPEAAAIVKTNIIVRPYVFDAVLFIPAAFVRPLQYKVSADRTLDVTVTPLL